MRKLTSIALHTILAIAAFAVSCTALAGNGSETYKFVCSSCHEVGIDGAPRIDDEIAWMQRINQGVDTLYSSTLNGKCKVLVQANRKDLSDQTIKEAVDYIVSRVKR
jgi:cytochrome c5